MNILSSYGGAPLTFSGNSAILGRTSVLTASSVASAYLGTGAGGSKGGTSQTGVGAFALGNSDSSNTWNTAVGSLSAYQLGSTSSFNTTIGGRSGTLLQGSHNVAVGEESFYNLHGDYSTAVGAAAGFIAYGERSTFVGYLAGASSKGDDCVYIGAGTASLSSQPNSSQNVFVGNLVGQNCRNVVQSSVLLGHQAGSMIGSQDPTQPTQVPVWMTQCSPQLPLSLLQIDGSVQINSTLIPLPSYVGTLKAKAVRSILVTYGLPDVPGTVINAPAVTNSATSTQTSTTFEGIILNVLPAGGFQAILTSGDQVTISDTSLLDARNICAPQGATGTAWAQDTFNVADAGTIYYASFSVDASNLSLCLARSMDLEKVRLHLNFDGACIDQSVIRHAVSGVSQFSMESAFDKLGQSLILWNSTTTYVEATDFDLSLVQDFTIEFWLRGEYTDPGYILRFGTEDSAQTQWSVQVNHGAVSFQSGTTTLSLGKVRCTAFDHFVVTRCNGVTNTYCAGAQVGGTTSPLDLEALVSPPTAPFALIIGDADQTEEGYIDELRVTTNYSWYVLPSQVLPKQFIVPATELPSHEIWVQTVTIPRTASDLVGGKRATFCDTFQGKLYRCETQDVTLDVQQFLFENVDKVTASTGNVFAGALAAQHLTGASSSVILGASSAQNGQNLFSTVGIGCNAMANSAYVNEIVSLGINSASSAKYLASGTLIGPNVATNLTGGSPGSMLSNVVAIGSSSAANFKSTGEQVVDSDGTVFNKGSQLVFLGDFSGQNAVDIANTVAIGHSAASAAWDSSVGVNPNDGQIVPAASLTSVSGVGNCYIGLGTAMYAGGKHNTAIGYQSMSGSRPSTVSGATRAGGAGSDNVVLGAFAASGLLHSSGNTIAGTSAATLITSGANNAIFGNKAAQVGDPDSSVIIGATAGQNMVGTRNLLLGYSAGAQAQGDDLILLGTNSGANLTQASNCLILGGYPGIQGQNDSLVISAPKSTIADLPLLQGSFSDQSLSINATLEVTQNTKLDKSLDVGGVLLCESDVLISGRLLTQDQLATTSTTGNSTRPTLLKTLDITGAGNYYLFDFSDGVYHVLARRVWGDENLPDLLYTIFSVSQGLQTNAVDLVGADQVYLNIYGTQFNLSAQITVDAGFNVSTSSRYECSAAVANVNSSLTQLPSHIELSLVDRRPSGIIVNANVCNGLVSQPEALIFPVLVWVIATSDNLTNYFVDYFIRTQQPSLTLAPGESLSDATFYIITNYVVNGTASTPVNVSSSYTATVIVSDPNFYNYNYSNIAVPASEPCVSQSSVLIQDTVSLVAVQRDTLLISATLLQNLYLIDTQVTGIVNTATVTTSNETQTINTSQVVPDVAVNQALETPVTINIDVIDLAMPYNVSGMNLPAAATAQLQVPSTQVSVTTQNGNEPRNVNLPSLTATYPVVITSSVQVQRIPVGLNANDYAPQQVNGDIIVNTDQTILFTVQGASGGGSGTNVGGAGGSFSAVLKGTYQDTLICLAGGAGVLGTGSCAGGGAASAMLQNGTVTLVAAGGGGAGIYGIGGQGGGTVVAGLLTSTGQDAPGGGQGANTLVNVQAQPGYDADGVILSAGGTGWAKGGGGNLSGGGGGGGVLGGEAGAVGYGGGGGSGYILSSASVLIHQVTAVDVTNTTQGYVTTRLVQVHQLTTRAWVPASIATLGDYYLLSQSNRLMQGVTPTSLSLARAARPVLDTQVHFKLDLEFQVYLDLSANAGGNAIYLAFNSLTGLEEFRLTLSYDGTYTHFACDTTITGQDPSGNAFLGHIEQTTAGISGVSLFICRHFNFMQFNFGWTTSYNQIVQSWLTLANLYTPRTYALMMYLDTSQTARINPTDETGQYMLPTRNFVMQRPPTQFYFATSPDLTFSGYSGDNLLFKSWSYTSSGSAAGTITIQSMLVQLTVDTPLSVHFSQPSLSDAAGTIATSDARTTILYGPATWTYPDLTSQGITSPLPSSGAASITLLQPRPLSLVSPPPTPNQAFTWANLAANIPFQLNASPDTLAMYVLSDKQNIMCALADSMSQPIGPSFDITVSSYDLDVFVGTLTVSASHGEGYRTSLCIYEANASNTTSTILAISPGVGLDQTYPSAALHAHPQVSSPADPTTSYFDLFLSPIPTSFAPLTAAVVAVFSGSTSLPYTRAQIDASSPPNSGSFDLTTFNHLQIGSGTLTPAAYYWIVAYVADAANNVTLSTPMHMPLDAYAPVVLTSALSQSFSDVTVTFMLRETSLWTSYLYVLTGISDSAAMSALNAAQAQATSYQVFAMSNGSTTTMTTPFAIDSTYSRKTFPNSGPFRAFLRVIDEVANTTTMDLGQVNLVQALTCNLTNNSPYFKTGNIVANIALDRPTTSLPTISILDSRTSTTYQGSLILNTPTQIQAQWVSDNMTESVYNNISIVTPYGSQTLTFNPSVIVDRTLPTLTNVNIDASNPSIPSANVTFQTFDANYKDSVIVVSNSQSYTNNMPFALLLPNTQPSSVSALYVTEPSAFLIDQGDAAPINITITGLAFDTDYQCIIQSRDLAGNVSQITQMPFYTPDVYPPVIDSYNGSSYQTSAPRTLTSTISVQDIGRTEYPVTVGLLPVANSLSTSNAMQQIHDYALAHANSAFAWTTVTNSNAISVSNTSYLTATGTMSTVSDNTLMYLDVVTQDETTLKNLGVYNVAIAYSITTAAGDTPLVARSVGQFRPDIRLFRTILSPSSVSSIEAADSQGAQYLLQSLINLQTNPNTPFSVAYARSINNTIYVVDQREGQSLLGTPTTAASAAARISDSSALIADSQFSLYVLEQPSWTPPNPDLNVITHVDVTSTSWTVPYVIQQGQSFTITVYTISGYLSNGPIQAVFTDDFGHTLQIPVILTGTYLAYGAQHSVVVNSSDCSVLSKFTTLALNLPLTTSVQTTTTSLLFYFDLVAHSWTIQQSHIETSQRYLDITITSNKDNLLRVREISATNPVVQMQRIYSDPNDVSFDTGTSSVISTGLSSPLKYESYQIDLTRLLPGQYYAAVFYQEDDGSTDVQVWPVVFSVSSSMGVASSDLKARPVWLYYRDATEPRQILWVGGSCPTAHYVPSSLDLSVFNQPAGSSEVSFTLEVLGSPNRASAFTSQPQSTHQFLLDTFGSWVQLEDSVTTSDMQHPVGLDIDWSTLFSSTFTLQTCNGPRLFVTTEITGGVALSKVRSGTSYTPETFSLSPASAANGTSQSYNVIKVAASNNQGFLQYDAANSRFIVSATGSGDTMCINMTPDGNLSLSLDISTSTGFATQTSTNSLTLASSSNPGAVQLVLYLLKSGSSTPVNILDIPDHIVNQYSLETQSTIQGMRSIICTTAEPVAAITNNFSISCWVQLHGKAVTFSVGRAFFEWSVNGTGQSAQTATWVDLWFNGAHYQTALTGVANNNIGDGAWHNIVLTAIIAGAATVFTMYSDGAILFNWSAPSMQALPQDAVLSLLGSPTTSDQEYSVVDETSMWAGTLTTQEVQSIWNNGAPTNLSRMVSNSLLLLWYRFDQPFLSGGTAELVLDYSGRGNSATVYGSGSVLETISFSPSQITYVLPWNVLSSLLKNITIVIIASGNEFTLRLPYTYSSTSSTTSNGTLVLSTDNYLRVKVKATQGLQMVSATGSVSLVQNAPSIIAITIDSQGGLVVQQKSISDSGSGIIAYTNSSFASTLLAAQPYIASVSRLVTSKGTVLSHLSMYDSCFTQSQLSQVLSYTSQTLLSAPTPAVQSSLPALKAWYVFTSTSTTTGEVLDLTGNGYTIQTSLFSNNTALFNQFDGINATQISLLNRGSMVFPSVLSANAGWTFTTWIRFPSANLPQPTWCSQWSDANSATRAIFILSSGVLLRFKRNDSNSRLIASFNTSIADNSWHHVAISVAADYSYHVFVDGQESCTYTWEQGSFTPPLIVSSTGQVALEQFTTTSPIQFSIASLSAGSVADDSSSYASWVGADDIALYTNVLTQSSIQSLASSQTIDLNIAAQSFGANLRFWYRFEDIPTEATDGTPVVDASGHGNDAVISNFANLISARVLGDPFAADSFFGLGMDVVGSLQSLTSQSQLHDQEIASLTDTEAQLTTRVSKLETGKNQFTSPVQILAPQVSAARITDTASDSVLELAGTASSTVMDMASGNSQSSFAVKWNASSGSQETFLVGSMNAAKWLMDPSNNLIFGAFSAPGTSQSAGALCNAGQVFGIDNLGNVSMSGALTTPNITTSIATVNGPLQVNGDVTFSGRLLSTNDLSNVSSSTIYVADKLLRLAEIASPASSATLQNYISGAGVTLDDNNLYSITWNANGSALNTSGTGSTLSTNSWRLAGGDIRLNQQSTTTSSVVIEYGLIIDTNAETLLLQKTAGTSGNVGTILSGHDILPQTNNAFNLGSASNRWNSLNVNTLSVLNSNVSGNLAVTGTSTLGGNIILNGSLTQTATAYSFSIAGSTQLGSTLSVANTSSLTGINNTGTISSTGAISGPMAASTLSASAATTLNNTLSVSNTTTTNGITNTGTIASTGAISGPHAATTLSASAATTLNNTLSVSGTTTTNGLTNTGTISSTGAISGPHAATTLSASAATSLNSTLSVSGPCTLSGTLSALSGITNTGTFTSTGSISGPIAASTLTASGICTLSSTLASGVHTITGVNASNQSLVSLASSSSTNTLVLGQTLASNGATVLGFSGATSSKATLGVFGGNALSIDYSGNAMITGLLTASAGLTVNQPSGSATTFIGPGGSGSQVNIDWTTYPYGGTTGVTNPAVRWQMTDVGSYQDSINLLTNASGTATSALTSRLFLSPAGLFGINNASPAYTIDVNGTARMSSTGTGLILGDTVPDGSNRTICALNSSMGTGTAKYITLGQGQSNNNQAEVAFYYAGSGSTGNRLGLGLYGGERVSIQGGGNVGFNNTSPSYGVDINGTARITGTTILGSTLQAPVINGPPSATYTEPFWSTTRNGPGATGQSLYTSNYVTLPSGIVLNIYENYGTGGNYQMSSAGGLQLNAGGCYNVTFDLATASNNACPVSSWLYLIAQGATVSMTVSGVNSSGGGFSNQGTFTPYNCQIALNGTTYFNPGTNTGTFTNTYNVTSVITGSSASFSLTANLNGGSVQLNSVSLTLSAQAYLFNKAITVGPTGSVAIAGSLSKGSGSFQIRHPLAPETTDLVHSFVEGARCDLQYRGRVALQNGTAKVNLDLECTGNGIGMRPGTFEALCRDPQVYLQNNVTWARVKGWVDKANLYITCEDCTADCIIDWMVVAERQDKHIKEWDKTDSDGRLLLEHPRLTSMLMERMPKLTDPSNTSSGIRRIAEGRS